jgi:hypothetical protein
VSLPCPGCKADIDDDSCFCDQCGAELMKCGMCGYMGKGKVCPHDRTPLLPAKALTATRGATASVTPPAVSPAAAYKPMDPTLASSAAPVPAAPAPTPAPAPAPTAAPTAAAAPVASPPVAPPAAPRALCLRSAAHGVQLRPAPGDVLGRRFGPHADVLARFSQVSSNHLALQRDATGKWSGSDMNSFNGSFYNGRKLAPGQAQPLDAGGTLVLGDLAFTVSFE